MFLWNAGEKGERKRQVVRQLSYFCLQLYVEPDCRHPLLESASRLCVIFSFFQDSVSSFRRESSARTMTNNVDLRLFSRWLNLFFRHIHLPPTHSRNQDHLFICGVVRSLIFRSLPLSFLSLESILDQLARPLFRPHSISLEKLAFPPPLYTWSSSPLHLENLFHSNTF